MTQREEFEKWYADQEKYGDAHKQDLLKCWQAAKSTSFSLPERMHHELEGDRVADSHANAFCDGYNQCLSEVIALVEEAESQNEHA